LMIFHICGKKRWAATSAWNNLSVDSYAHEYWSSELGPWSWDKISHLNVSSFFLFPIFLLRVAHHSPTPSFVGVILGEGSHSKLGSRVLPRFFVLYVRIFFNLSSRIIVNYAPKWQVPRSRRCDPELEVSYWRRQPRT
jgi:hypothetical protein